MCLWKDVAFITPAECGCCFGRGRGHWRNAAHLTRLSSILT